MSFKAVIEALLFLREIFYYGKKLVVALREKATNRKKKKVKQSIKRIDDAKKEELLDIAADLDDII